ncbi:MAG: M42 family metallopeptidase [Saprospiraceae bacterium]|uniref:M42 family metallopeptidase n=1 Tax=Candidatus Defluviibacterium haderslevense TaxID=2981993 RepID=A0A9D7SEF6_9BACT|nr:M42 family metallopeptidase [Candidatus Defluviibacterium haderslevense]MBK9719826.1 M42 family metallopeptidase [Candidatus Defluviibacterium haderslevense]MBL0236448.1 M42 family metallopeptidase [Candidatus Defluviibacterium haderslevense]
MSIINKKSEEFLFEYLNNASPTGHEASGQKIWLDYIKDYVDEWHLDYYGTLYSVVNPGKDFKVIIEGHSDEISWMVNYITDDGYIYVIRNGGSDQSIAPSKRVNIHTEKGFVKGIFGWPAIHMRKGIDTNMTATIENIFIDVGAKDKEEVEKMGIHVGQVITYEDTLMKLNDTFYVGRALDNRMGGFCIAEVARLLKKNKVKLPFSLYIVNSVQEEIGLRGAEMIAETIKPNIAIVTDVTHDTHTPMVKTKEQGSIKCGSGPVICYAPAVHNTLQKLVVKTAAEKEIPIQRSAASRSTGTDTDAFAYSNGGVPSVLISLPLRYMHTTVESAHKADIEHVIKLIYEVLLAIDPKKSLKYF